MQKESQATIFFSIVEENIAITHGGETYLLSDGKIDPNNPNEEIFDHKTEIENGGIPAPSAEQEQQVSVPPIKDQEETKTKIWQQFYFVAKMT